MDNSEIQIFTTKDGKTEIEVQHFCFFTSWNEMESFIIRMGKRELQIMAWSH